MNNEYEFDKLAAEVLKDPVARLAYDRNNKINKILNSLQLTLGSLPLTGIMDIQFFTGEDAYRKQVRFYTWYSKDKDIENDNIEFYNVWCQIYLNNDDCSYFINRKNGFYFHPFFGEGGKTVNEAIEKTILSVYNEWMIKWK